MKFDAISASKLMLLASLSLEVAANSGYYASCIGLQLLGPVSNAPFWSINANCEEESTVWNVATEINLGSCFGNSNGKLVASKNGAFGGSCKDVTLSGSTLKASCANTAGTYVSTSIDTNNYIGNANGLMCCFNSCSNL
ncbi:hypothetical protein N7456_000657 [Penicillium angulare]|uniref:Cyanovirin-N domain-containing protein n=1 Tax=Penicillium angulare TaxID=116970 RepID=A0A9W9GCF6_9EURO|nr:hypothetical protein N7456_000657 [Penicillium angulare]